ncbi:MAG: SMC-Scp complex subunit ScpB [Thermodesulfobacteriota bacterium]
MDDVQLKPILESLIFISESPLRLETLMEILPESDKEAILEGIAQIKEEYAGDAKGFELMEVAGGYQFRTKPRWAAWVNRLRKAKAVKLSRSALETLAIIAYRQPIIRAEIEEIRGVDSGWVLRTLLEKDLIRIVSRRDIPGRPLVYGTTKTFLEIFNLNTLSDLPTLREIEPPTMPEGAQKETLPNNSSEGVPAREKSTQKEPES